MNRQSLAALVIAVFVLLAGRFWPGVDVETRPELMAGLIALVALLFWLTELIPLYVTSLTVLFFCLTFLLPCLQEAGSPATLSTFSSPFFSNIILLFLGGFVLSAGWRRQKIDSWFAACLLEKSGGSLPMMMLFCLSTTAFLSMWISNTAAATIMLSLIIPLVHDLPADSPAKNSLILAIPFAANVGGLGTPIGSPPNAIAIQYLQKLELAPSFSVWMLIGVPGVLGMIVFIWLVLMWLYPLQDLHLPQLPVRQTWEWSQETILVVIVSGLTILGWLTADLHHFSTGTIALIPVVLFFGTGLLQTPELKALSWDVLLLMGGGLCLGEAIRVSGLADLIVGQLPVKGFSVYLLMVMFGTLACLMSALMSNTATANLMLPIAASLEAEPMRPILIGIAFCCTLAMPLPISTPPNALVFSSGELRFADLQKTGTIITVGGLCLIFTTAWWWWKLWDLF